MSSDSHQESCASNKFVFIFNKCVFTSNKRVLFSGESLILQHRETTELGFLTQMDSDGK